MPGAASGCLTCLLVLLLATGIKHRCGRRMALCDLLGRDGGAFLGEQRQPGAVLRVAALAADLTPASLPGFASMSLVPGSSLVSTSHHVSGLAGSGVQTPRSSLLGGVQYLQGKKV